MNDFFIENHFCISNVFIGLIVIWTTLMSLYLYFLKELHEDSTKIPPKYHRFKTTWESK